jgi:CheY-like chemotaxis protein
MERKCVIVVVDDEKMMEEYIEELLQKRGYEHKSFDDPAKALDYFAENAESVDLIISDIKMPHIDGLELTRRAADIKNHVPVILLSGYSERLPEAATMENVRAVLEKPLLKTDLLQAVEGALTGCRPEPPEHK